MPFPLLTERFPDFFFRLGIDYVDNHLFGLQEAVYSVNCLNKVVELIVNTDEYRTVAIFLKIAPAAGKALLCGEYPCFALLEVNNAAFAFVIVHTAVNVDSFGNSLFNRMTFRFEVVP